MPTADAQSLDVIYRNARTYSAWLDKPVDPELLRRAYDLAKLGPTSANCCPMRIVFVASRQAKETLKPALASGNVDKTMSAPVTAIIGHDLNFASKLPKLWPHNPDMFKNASEENIKATAFRNGSLQGAYFMLAARALGLDCGPMSGFDNAKVDALFFANTQIKSNFLCNLGYGDPSKLRPRNARLDFDEACGIH